MLEQLLQLELFALAIVFIRIGTIMMFLPGFSAQFVSMRIRLALALAITFVVTPVLVDDLPVMPESPAAFGLLVLGEAAIGVFIGSLARAITAALQAAGVFTSLFSSLANALILDPIAEQQSATIGGFLSILGLVLVFVSDLHHLMLRALVDSYGLFAPGSLMSFGDATEMLARTVTDAFALGLKLSSPFLIVGLTYYVGIGVLGRLMPQLPVFFFGLPLQISIQIWVMALALSGMMLVFLQHFSEGIGAILAP